ncbi:MAG: DUF1573 domain-containing protein [Verrucomicrobia bacterium]|nr:MAG: DUF1573 domain-containing protein [Verrucomicrobiota bacterium]
MKRRHFKVNRPVFFVLLLMLAVGCGRQAPPTAGGDTPAKRQQAARQYMAHVPLADTLEATAEQIAAQREPAQRSALRELLRREVRQHVVAEATIAALARHFTVAEINALAEFNAKPEARSIQGKLPAYTVDVLRPLHAELERVLSVTNAANAALRWKTRLLEFNATVADDHLLAEFPFMNMGNRSVNILGVTSTCACVTGAADATNYPPRQGGVVRLAFDFGPRIGLQSKYILVRTDDPSEPEVRLQVDVQIPELVRIEPSFAYWQIGATPTASVHRVSLLQPDCTMTGIIVSNPIFRAQLITNTPGRSYAVRVSPTACTQRAFDRVELLVAVAPDVIRRFPVFVSVDVTKPPAP